jgi:glycosyltransferase involved in cell wall biosynthesis
MFNNGKKTILLLSDDMRMTSGIATMSREFVIGTVDKYNWVQLGAAINHPDQGKEFDLSEDVRKQTGIEDANIRVIPFAGYGNGDVIRQLMMRYKPDAILHFTDPRYWRWLYEIEAELRQEIPIFFYHIWDDLPDPEYNRDYYESCDWLGCISRQTYGIVSRVGKIDSSTITPLKDWQVSYVPHGINPDVFKPVDVPQSFKDQALQGKEFEFTLFWMNRNIKRKQPSDVIWAFKMFVDGLPENKRDKVCLLMHTSPVDQNGTDLVAVKNKIAPDCNVFFSTSRVDQKHLNYIYNLSDVTINIAGNEGFGLTTAESLMAGTPTIINVTGGLQDQAGFKWKKNGKLITAEEYIEIGSLHDWRKYENQVEAGPWCKPVWPRVQTMVGSVPTPYILDDKVDVVEVAKAIRDWYDTPKDKRRKLAKQGREWMLGDGGLNSKNMCDQFVKGMETAWAEFKPKKRLELFKIA